MVWQAAECRRPFWTCTLALVPPRSPVQAFFVVSGQSTATVPTTCPQQRAAHQRILLYSSFGSLASGSDFAFNLLSAKAILNYIAKKKGEDPPNLCRLRCKQNNPLRFSHVSRAVYTTMCSLRWWRVHAAIINRS